MVDEVPLHRCRLVVVGQVQRVGFRWFVRERARRFGLSGWVQNREDGSVEVCVSGPEAIIAQLTRNLSVGPKGAVVSAVREAAYLSVDPLQFTFAIHR